MDYIKRFIIAIIMVLCVSLLFLGGKTTKAQTTESIKITAGVDPYYRYMSC